MVAAVGSASVSAVSATSGGGFGTAGLEAQIARYEKQLADCVNCSSAKTPEGKKAIAEISNKISSARARIDEVQSTKQVTRPAAAIAGTASRSSVAPDASPATADGGKLAQTKSVYSTVGSLVDVFG